MSGEEKKERKKYNGFALEIDVAKKVRGQLDRLPSQESQLRVAQMVVEGVKQGVGLVIKAPAKAEPEKQLELAEVDPLGDLPGSGWEK